MTGHEETQELRQAAFAIAYRMLGSVADAEDVVQEALLRYHRKARDETIDSPVAFLTTVTTRLAIDSLRRARARRETYAGPWLPEPLLTDQAPDVAEQAETADSLSLAFLVLLESLSPVERAVFLLHDVFDYGYDEIAGIVRESEDNCRQLAARARRHVEEKRPRFETSRQERERLAAAFFAACEAGELQALVGLLSHDVVLYGDGGGKAPAAPKPVFGREKVIHLLMAIATQSRKAGIRARPAEVNGQPGALFTDRPGRIVYLMSLDIADGLVQTVRSIVNPDKLGHLGPLADLAELAEQAKAAARRPGNGSVPHRGDN
ncbi:MAG TPA: RNA polymerase sigma-70 factor [Streptosporangiaceae bacterium]|jgi:RNA polymerase sigma-70 factor (ECF subfamily)